MPSESFQTARRRHALVALLVFTIPASALFLALNIHQGLVLLPLGNLALGLTSVGLLLASRRGLPLVPIATAYLLALVAMFLLVMLRPDVHPNGHVYITCIPVISYILLGPDRGLWLTVASLIAGVAAYLAGAGARPELMQPVTLLNAATVILGIFIVCHFWSRSQADANMLLAARSETDPLTGLGNRNALDRAFGKEKARWERSGHAVSIILLDLDHFKRINDHYGHEAGDSILVELARLMMARLRPTDAAFRIGGEEFLVVLPDTDAAGAATLAENLRVLVASKAMRVAGAEVNVTFSAGIAELGRDGTEWAQLYRCADDRLYACKAGGRNRIRSVTAEPPRTE
ncbi:GGDEF domain-containing protein [Aquisalimonas lutea]|uniref:GGDEF domain-containing protein n=1 Tax=Aquisalimonas lutea TaxID=1327750 RepID=UPI0025B3F7BB|nr:GGDEF domain-containing protein [Aquisalimonas lutea]MDN3517442.1 GGDEF domain-containing protein [Aquisalimonas lutea]